jgi:hypothetical protein
MTKEAFGCWRSKAEEGWSCIAEDRHLADASDVDDDNSYIDNEEGWPLAEGLW